jgi:hypothetical protein
VIGRRAADSEAHRIAGAGTSSSHGSPMAGADEYGSAALQELNAIHKRIQQKHAGE